MSPEADFLEQVHDALGRLHDLPYLDVHPLARRFWPEEPGSGPRRGQRLQRLLLEAIEALSPVDATERLEDAKRYLILVRRYIDGAQPEEVAREMAYSRRQFFRHQRRAIALLADRLWHRLPEAQPRGESPDDLLAAEAEPVLAQRELVGPAELVEGVLQAMRPLAESRGVAMVTDLPKDLPPIFGNRTLLRQALLRTVSDRVQQPGTLRVCLRLRGSAGWVRVDIRRIGMPGRHTAETEEALSTARRLVEMQGGRWQAPEGEAYGDIYSLELPAERPRILLAVEDNEAVIRAFRRYLAGTHYEVAAASSLKEAVRLARELKPDVITLDIMMPSQDGWEVLQALKNDPLTQGIPVLICSVLEDSELARSLGAAGAVRKPVTQAALLAALSRLEARQCW
mgnify:CR=1 FL=1